MQPLSFRARLTLRWTVVFSCILAAASAAIDAGVRAASYEGLDRQLRTLAATEITSTIDGPTPFPHIHDLPETALAGGTFTEKLVQVYDADAELLIASPGRARRTRLATPTDIAAALGGDAPVTTIDVEGVPVRVVVLRTTFDGRVYAIAVGVVMSEMLASLTRLNWLLAIVWAVSTVVTAAVGFRLASTALRPVHRITERALEIAGTNLGARLEPPSVNDEIGVMTNSLNTLIDRLHGALEANRRFAADAAHELRGPVTAMAGEIEVALRRERTAEDYKETLARVQSRLASLSSLIGDLMLLVRSQESRTAIPTQDVPLAGLVEAAIGRLGGLAQSRGVSIRVERLDGVIVRGESGLLGRVFDNILDNAIRYNREHGQVRISAVAAAPASGGAPEPTVTIEVYDTGVGIPEGERERVFNRFHRVDVSRNRHTGGTGLGLAIAREVLALFHGSIRVSRSSAQGTVIEVQLPGGQMAAADALQPAS
jgi:two-component system OmpR family sensor kinase